MKKAVDKTMKRIMANLSMSFKLFIKSFKDIDINFIYILFFDLLFYMSIFLSTAFFYNLIANKLGQLAMMVPTGTPLTPDQLMTLAPKVKSIVYQAIALAIIYVLIIIALWALLRGLVWLFTLKKPFSYSYIFSFVGLNILWFAFWAIITFFFGIISKKIAFFVLLFFIILPLFLFYTPIIFTLFDKKIWAGIKRGLIFGKYVGKLIISYILALLVFIIMTAVINLLNFLPNRTYLFIMGALLLLFLTWLRLYLSSVILYVAKKQKY